MTYVRYSCVAYSKSCDVYSINRKCNLPPPLRRLTEEQQECFTAGSPSAEQAAVLSQREQKFWYPEAVFHHFVELVCRRVLQLDSRSRRTGPCRPRSNYMQHVVLHRPRIFFYFVDGSASAAGFIISRVGLRKLRPRSASSVNPSAGLIISRIGFAFGCRHIGSLKIQARNRKDTYISRLIRIFVTRY